MDTKLKNNSKKRGFLTIIGILIITSASVFFISIINQNVGKRLELMQQNAEIDQELNGDVLQQIYIGSYVLYMESMQRDGAKTAADIFLEIADEETFDYTEELTYIVNERMERAISDFEGYRSEIDYCLRRSDGTYEKNTSQPLEELFTNETTEIQDMLENHYNAYFVLHFDGNSLLTVEPLYMGNVDADLLIKTIGQLTREYEIWDNNPYDDEGTDIAYSLKGPANFDIIYAIPQTSNYQLIWNDYVNGADYWTALNLYAQEGGQFLYFVALVLIVVLMCVMTSGKVWKCDMDFHRPGKWYLMEASCIGAICVWCWGDTFLEMMYRWSIEVENTQFQQASGILEKTMNIAGFGLQLYGMYAIWYLSARFIRPVFTLGVREYVKEYSFFYQIFPWMKRQWEKFKDEVEHIDFSKKSVKTIVKIVVLNFVILALCSTFWFYGIFMLIIYSAIVFYLIMKYYRKVQHDYEILLGGVNRMAEGDLDTEIIEDLGMFEPIKGELAKVRTGFKMAVEEEVKSQRMKTELITNVSHDLKTPLTAITTYVELLKKEDITDEERRSYVEILERKALRLKVLVEDLFEVSKASSNNITLDLMDVDVTNLMKQVSVEHTEKFAAMGLELRWNVPEEKVIVKLDNQKTYRIFENLFVNIQKYAMPNSRVYIDVTREDGQTQIIMKNMSAVELNVRPEELTERFVRGDAARNTEGSGLGLAIVKSFAEAQGGDFRVEVDGDLFKAIIAFKA